jgi:hypothetical protein
MRIRHLQESLKRLDAPSVPAAKQERLSLIPGQVISKICGRDDWPRPKNAASAIRTDKTAGAGDNDLHSYSLRKSLSVIQRLAPEVSPNRYGVPDQTTLSF